MASSPTTRNRLNKQGTGDNTGTWGGVLNTQGIDLIDEAMDGLTSIPVSGNVTLTSTNYATDQARRRVLKLTGAPGASYTVTIPSVEKFYIVINSTNAAQTIKASGVGVSIPAAVMTTVVCDGTDCFAPAQTVTAAIGTVCDFAGTSAPAGWLLCYGQAISRAAYAALFGVIGTIYGTGDGSTTFNLPDLRGRVVAGPDSMGGVAAGRLTGYTATSVGGSQSETLSIAQLPNVTFTPQGSVTVSFPAHTYDRFSDAGDTQTTAGGTSSVQIGGGGNVATSTTPPGPSAFSLAGTVVSFGSNLPHANVQPTMAMNKIIYAGV